MSTHMSNPKSNPESYPELMPSADPLEELHQLVSAQLDGEPAELGSSPLSETQRLHLSALLRDDPARQAEYLDHVLLDELLRWEGPSLAKPIIQVQPTQQVELIRFARWRWLGRVAVAAAVALAALGLVLIGPLLSPERTAVQAKPDIVDRLADWNLAISDLPSPTERRAVFAARAEAFAVELRDSDLSPEERQLAEMLLESARAMSTAESPLKVAEQLDGASERLLSWMRTHTDAPPSSARAVERQYLRFVERNLGRLQTLAATSTDDELTQQRLDRLSRRIARRAQERVAREAERSDVKAKKSLTLTKEEP